MIHWGMLLSCYITVSGGLEGICAKLCCNMFIPVASGCTAFVGLHWSVVASGNILVALSLCFGGIA